MIVLIWVGMMKLNYDEVKDYKFEYTLACECGDGADKSLDAVVDALGVYYFVKSHKVKVIRTKPLKKAINAFNEAK